ncbi:MAG: glycosyltransferase family 39 protein [Acetobacteraceae bacterium]
MPCAVLLCLAAWLRGAEYDEQYTLFLTSGVVRPDWPATVFPAGLARELQSGTASFSEIADDLRVTDVHPPLYFWLVSIWRRVLGSDLFTARLLSVVLGLGSLTLVGAIARQAQVKPVWAMVLTVGFYGFTYTSVVARGFALAQLLLLGGVVGLLTGRRCWHFVLAGALFGAATMSNYLAAFAAGACLVAVGWNSRPFRLFNVMRGGRTPIHHVIAAVLGFLVFVPADLWWFLAQRGSRRDQFPPFSLGRSLARLAARFAGDLLGGLPLYVPGAASAVVAAALGLLLLWLIARIVWRWRHIGNPRARSMFALGALGPAAGLLALGAIFNNTPIELRYLTFSTPFVGLLLAGVLGWRDGGVLLAVQAASIAGLMLAPQTMQPARATAQAAAAWVEDGVVLLPRGNDGVGVVGAFAIEAPPALPLLLIRPDDTPARILARVAPWHRVVLALLDQDASSHAASEAMRLALTTQDWREVARGSNVAVYERTGGWE